MQNISTLFGIKQPTLDARLARDLDAIDELVNRGDLPALPAVASGFARRTSVYRYVRSVEAPEVVVMKMSSDKCNAALKRFAKVRKCGRGWAAPCPAHSDRCRSLTIGIGRNGKLLLHCHFGCSFAAIVTAAGLADAELRGLEPPPELTREERIRAARGLWDGSLPAANTVVAVYLRNRGIELPMPRSIRFLPLHDHHDFGWPFPCLIGGLQDGAGSFSGVSITWLSADGSDKAPVMGEPVRKVYGILHGAAVRLAEPTATLVLCEGIETGLSVQMSTGLPTWAALGAANLPHLQVPQGMREVVIAADNDPAGLAAAQLARARLLREGRRARIVLPPAPANDFNEMVA